MAGTIYPRGKNVFQVRIFLGYDPETGKRRNLCRTVHGTKKDAQTLLTKLLRDRDTGEIVEPSKLTVGAFLDRWIKDAATGRVRARTLDDYQAIIRRYLKPAFGGRRLDQLTALEIQSFYTKMQAPKPHGMALAPRTVRYAHAVLHSALKQAVRWRILASNAAEAVELPRQTRREMEALSPEQASRFLQAAKSYPGDPEVVEKNGSDPRAGREDRWYALWVLLVTGGLRPGEALGLKWTDLDGSSLRIQRTLVERTGKGWTLEEPKTNRSRRTVALPESTVRALQQHRAKQAKERLKAGDAWQANGLMFCTAIGTPERQSNIFRRHFKPLLRAAGLPDVRMYDLRHTAATLLLSAGENPKVVSERLGHSSITLTMDTYSHVLPDMQQRAAEKLEGMLFG